MNRWKKCVCSILCTAIWMIMCVSIVGATTVYAPAAQAEFEPEPQILVLAPTVKPCISEVVKGSFSEVAKTVSETVDFASKEVQVIEPLDRTKPIYEVYKNGWFVADATAEVQWIIRDLCEQYDLPEKAIYGLICAESTFVPNLESFDGGCWGLAQINTFWTTRANIEHFTDDYRSRDLCDPYDNLLTLAEMMCYARDTYGLDYSQRADLVKYLYWHNTGQDPTRVTRWDYATRALGYADELVPLQS